MRVLLNTTLDTHHMHRSMLPNKVQKNPHLYYVRAPLFLFLSSLCLLFV